MIIPGSYPLRMNEKELSFVTIFRFNLNKFHIEKKKNFINMNHTADKKKVQLG